MAEHITIDIETLYSDKGVAKLARLGDYVQRVREIAGVGNVAILTGQGPIWLYLKIAHAFHGKAVKLVYNSPVTGDVVIFDHSPY